MINLNLALFQPPPPVSGIDVIINLNIPDKAAIRRACGRRKHKVCSNLRRLFRTSTISRTLNKS